MQDDIIICKQVIASTLSKVEQVSGYPAVIKGTFATNTRLPNPSGVIGQLDFKTFGYVHGMGAVIT